jgi:CRISPR-associated protein Csm4
VSLPPLLRVRIALRAPLGTPLASGTIFGHLCWAIRAGDGEDELVRWLAAQQEAPTLVSDGFPVGLLPRPLLAPARRSGDLAPDKAQEAKDRARRPWIKAEDFARLRGRLGPQELAAHLHDDPWRGEAGEARIAHNRIDRLTSTTPKEGGLFFVDEDWSFASCPERDIYVRSAMSVERVRSLFAGIGEDGYGRDATWGRGRFEVVSVMPSPALDAQAGNRWMSLSHGTVTQAMAEPRYRLATHFGKLGEAAARGGARPWKRPLLLARPGATFAAPGAGPFGTLLDGVHQDAAWVRHDARHVAIRFTEAGGT